MSLDIPLMAHNISTEDLEHVITFLRGEPILTGNIRVMEFEQEWSKWLGVKYSVFVNSGSSANFLSMAIVRELLREKSNERNEENGPWEIIVPPLCWISNIVSVLKNGLRPVFVDINQVNLSMDPKEIIRKITPRTKAVFLVHIMGFNALTDELLDELRRRDIILIEDACESIGTLFKGNKVGTFGAISNFSFYYGHHMTTVEGGMICTNDEGIYQMARMMRGHGMVRESTDERLRRVYTQEFPDLREDFIFALEGYNFRNNELNAVMGTQQLKRLDDNNQARIKRFRLFLDLLDPGKFFVDFDLEGSCNYALLIILRKADVGLIERLAQVLKENKVEFRRGISGGGNQLRQPYLRRLGLDRPENFPVTEHVHFNGFYVGNYPGLSGEKIQRLCQLLNEA